jgi:PAS domain S-box-containing protein
MLPAHDLPPADVHAPAGSEAQFQITFESAPLGIATVNSDGRWVKVNQALCRILGYSVDELTNRPIHEFTHPEDLARDKFHWDELRGSKNDRYEIDKRYLRKDGAIVWARLTISRARMSDEDYFIAIVDDISARKEAEEALRRQADLVDQSYDAILSWKLGGGIVYWSRGAEALYGFTREEAIGRSSDELLKTRCCISNREREAQIEQQGIWHGEMIHTARDGREIIVDSRHVRVRYGDETYALETNSDVTGRNYAEQELRKSEERFRLSLLQAPTPIMLFDDREEILAVSQSWLDGTGYSREELRRLEDWTTRAYRERSGEVLEILREIIATQPPAQPSEAAIRTKDGHERQWSFIKSVLGTQSDGRFIFVTVAQDLTERKAREEQARLLLREVSHRAKNMLSLVQAIARLTAASTPEDFIERFTSRIQALAANHDLLVRNEWRGADVDDLVRAQLAYFADLVGSRIAVSGPKMHLNAAAAQAIGFTLHELATNAGKYGALSTDAGRVEVQWRRDGEIFAMSWIERNGPPVRTPGHGGFGSTVIEAMVKHTLGGEVELDYAPSGLNWVLTCPAANVLDQPVDVGRDTGTPGGTRAS